jgi:hypothetical protein
MPMIDDIQLTKDDNSNNKTDTIIPRSNLKSLKTAETNV